MLPDPLKGLKAALILNSVVQKPRDCLILRSSILNYQARHGE